MIARVYRQTATPPTDSRQAQMSLWAEASAPFAVILRHSRRARRVAVRIGMGGQVELVVPRGVAEQQARAFLDSRSDWVHQHLARRRKALPPLQEFPPQALAIPLLGEQWRIFRSGGSGRPRLRALHQPSTGTDGDVRGGVLELRGNGTAHDWRRHLLAWLRRRALQALGQMLQEEATRHGFSFTGIGIRCQRTRWGSCSARGAISLNLALLFQPEDVVRYLLCHELAHTRHLDHSRRFWQCVAACEPRWRELDAALLQGWRSVPRWILEPA
jgi:predicted metal-dependent hydrolase